MKKLDDETLIRIAEAMNFGKVDLGELDDMIQFGIDAWDSPIGSVRQVAVIDWLKEREEEAA